MRESQMIEAKKQMKERAKELAKSKQSGKGKFGGMGVSNPPTQHSTTSHLHILGHWRWRQRPRRNGRWWQWRIIVDFVANS